MRAIACVTSGARAAIGGGAWGVLGSASKGGLNLDDDRDVVRQTANVGCGLLANFELVLLRMVAMWIMEQTVRPQV